MRAPAGVAFLVGDDVGDGRERVTAYEASEHLLALHHGQPFTSVLIGGSTHHRRQRCIRSSNSRNSRRAPGVAGG